MAMRVLYFVAGSIMVSYLVCWKLGLLHWLVVEAFAVALTVAVAECGNETANDSGVEAD
jgi:hypothetical protein